MEYLIFLIVAVALLAGFLALTHYEARRGTRILAGYRAQLDQEMERAAFVLSRVDFVHYLREEAKHLAERLGHDIAHLSLQLVRATERLLTRLVRHLRIRQDANPVSRESAREFVKTLADFKDQLQATRPDVPEIH